MTLVKVLLEILSIALTINVFPEVNGVGFELPGDAGGRASDGNWCYLKEEKCRQGSADSDWAKGNCILDKQSPINLDPNLKLSDSPTINLSPMADDAQYGPMSFKLISQGGHTVVANFDSSAGVPAESKIKWGNEFYTLAQFHFHWGPKDDTGSEHAVGGRSFSMEVHFVHYKSSSGDLAGAINSGKEDALLVVGFFLQADVKGSSPFMKKISGKIAGIIEPNTEVAEPELSIASLLKVFKGNTWNAYTYPGSLTTPGCNEIVRWVVVRKPILVDPTTVAEFRKILEVTDKPLTTSYRKLQKTNSRDVKLIKANF